MEQIKQVRSESRAINLADIMSIKFDRAYAVYKQTYYPFQYVVRAQYFGPLPYANLIYVSVHHVM